MSSPPRFRPLIPPPPEMSTEVSVNLDAPQAAAGSSGPAAANAGGPVVLSRDLEAARAAFTTLDAEKSRAAHTVAPAAGRPAGAGAVGKEDHGGWVEARALHFPCCMWVWVV